jgi:catechol 2,3-dioxygenase-like lactoylglutathione lyase family enzyme
MIDRLDHVMVVVADLAAAAARTAALFGRQASWRGSHPHYGTVNALFRLDNTYLELIAPARDESFGAVLRGRLAAEGEGVFGLAFGSADADATVVELRRRGIEIADPAPGSGRDDRTGAERRWRNAFLPPAASRGLLLFVIEHASPADSLPMVAPEGDPAAAVHALDHVVVASRDLDGTRALYGDGLGLRLALDRTFEQRGQRILFFRTGGATVEVVASTREPADKTAPDRFFGLAWRVPDADLARARTARAGFDVSELRPGAKPGTRVCTVRDAPGGVPTLLIEPAPG